MGSPRNSEVEMASKRSAKVTPRKTAKRKARKKPATSGRKKAAPGTAQKTGRKRAAPPRSGHKNKMGRPRIEIDWSEFDKLCRIQCTLEEIAGWFDCSVDTIENRVKEAHGITFSEYFAQKSTRGRSSLRRRQYTAAMRGDRTMLIWLGKQWLGQADKSEHRSLTHNTHAVHDLDLSRLTTEQLRSFRELVAAASSPDASGD